MKNSVRFFVWLAALLGASYVAVAQHSPQCTAENGAYNARVAGYRAEVAAFNARCASVEAGSPAAANAVDSGSVPSASISTHRGRAAEAGTHDRG